MKDLEIKRTEEEELSVDFLPDELLEIVTELARELDEVAHIALKFLSTLAHKHQDLLIN